MSETVSMRSGRGVHPPYAQLNNQQFIVIDKINVYCGFIAFNYEYISGDQKYTHRVK